MTQEHATLRDILGRHPDPAAAPTPGFRGSVRARLGGIEGNVIPFPTWLRRHAGTVLAAAAASVAVAVLAGNWAANVHEARERGRLVDAYVASLDPHARVGRLP
jgi:hypothetical protein